MTAHAPIYDPALPSLADLRQMIEARQDLPILRRRDMASAIHTLAGWFGLPEENVPASAKYMRDKLERVHAITASVSCSAPAAWRRQAASSAGQSVPTSSTASARVL